MLYLLRHQANPRQLLFYRALTAGLLFSIVLVLAATACGARGFSFPVGSGDTFSGFSEVFEEASRSCRGVRTMTAELQVTGKVGETALRIRAVAGLAHPDAVRLEGIAPFGRLGFVFVAKADQAVLLLPRENLVVTDQDPNKVLEALTGLPIEPAELRAILSGCVAPDPKPIGGRLYGQSLVAVDVGTQATVFVRYKEMPMKIIAGLVKGIALEFAEFSGSMPRLIRIRSARNPGGVPIDLVVRLSQLEINTTLDPLVFSVDVPPEAEPLSLEGLRHMGPLAMGSGR